MDHKPAVSARTGRTDFERRSSQEKKPIEKSLLSDRIKKHIEEIEQPKNQANQPQPANMLVNKRIVPSRVKTRYYIKSIRRYFCYVVLATSILAYFWASIADHSSSLCKSIALSGSGNKFLSYANNNVETSLKSIFKHGQQRRQWLGKTFKAKTFIP